VDYLDTQNIRATLQEFKGEADRPAILCLCLHRRARSVYGSSRPSISSDPLMCPETQERVKTLFRRGLQHDGEFDKAWPAVLGTVLDKT
jgi:hypothetical protein